MTKAVILCSGGINSSVMAAAAREQYEPALLHVSWGHRSAERELAAFGQIAAALQIEQTKVVELSGGGLFGTNPRTTRRNPHDEYPATHPAPFTVGLLPAFIGLAACWAEAIGAPRIMLGVTENHETGGTPISDLYPDYRREFVQTANLMLQYGKRPGEELLVEAPLLELSRVDVVKLGNLLGVPFAHTWSCYGFNDTPCGKCLGCITRVSGFLRAGLPDPLQLEPVPAN
jgi:7-cyano-7-deazaguanine synthase